MFAETAGSRGRDGAQPSPPASVIGRLCILGRADMCADLLVARVQESSKGSGVSDVQYLGLLLTARY